MRDFDNVPVAEDFVFIYGVAWTCVCVGFAAVSEDVDFTKYWEGYNTKRGRIHKVLFVPVQGYHLVVKGSRAQWPWFSRPRAPVPLSLRGAHAVNVHTKWIFLVVRLVKT